MGRKLRIASIIGTTGLSCIVYGVIQLEAKRLSLVECAPAAVSSALDARGKQILLSAQRPLGFKLFDPDPNMQVSRPSDSCEDLHGNGPQRVLGVLRNHALGEKGSKPAPIKPTNDPDELYEEQKEAVDRAISANEAFVRQEAASGVMPTFNPLERPGGESQ